MYAITSGGQGIVRVLKTKMGGEGGQKGGGQDGSEHPRRIRGATLRRYLEFARLRMGSKALEGILADAGIEMAELNDDGWYPVGLYELVLRGLDRRWSGSPGEGLFEAGRYASKLLGTVRQQVVRAASLEELAERAPIVWNKEFNFGRLEVLVGRGWAVFTHYDWYPFPELCKILKGTYTGILELNGVPGRVEETKCMRLGNDRCEYQVSWDAGPDHPELALHSTGQVT